MIDGSFHPLLLGCAFIACFDVAAAINYLMYAIASDTYHTVLVFVRVHTNSNQSYLH